MINFGHGVYLTRISFDNLEKIREQRNSLDIRRWSRQKDLLHSEGQAAWHGSQQKNDSVEMYEIHDSATRELVGICGLTGIDYHNRKAEFSVYTFTHMQRQGYASRSLKTLFNHGFYNLGLNMIWGETFDKNPAGQLFSKLGMKLAGTLPQTYFKHGKFVDSHLYAVTVDEWSKLPHAESMEKS